ncbi:MAG: methyl-accepting chemotaxis protein [Gammaproteobacteria bacterium]|nr:methyl-accepting chemotaxis protein [Gammaproteobacteria bacterium]
MKWLKESLRRRLILLFAGALIVNGAISEIFTGMERNSTEDLKSLIQKDLDHERRISDLTMLFKIQVQEWKNVLLRGHDSAQMDKYWGKFLDRHNEIQTKAAEIIDRLNDVKAKNLVIEFRSKHQQLKLSYQQGREAFISADFDHKQGDKAVSGIDREPTKLLQDAADIISNSVSALTNKAIAQSERTTAIARSAIILSTIILIVLVYLVLKSQFSRPIQSLMEHIDRFGSGDFSVPIKSRSIDELGAMRTQLGKSQDFLRDLLSQVKQTTAELNNNADSINKASSIIAHGTQDTTSRLEQTATAVTEMTSTVQEVAQNASGAANAASNADDSAQAGMQVMQSTINTINALSNEVRQASEVIKKLEEDTSSVGTVLDVIRGIAEQTNLLALNAAIEAARAGEQGRGFAVVADEVRNLAQRTQESTAEIQQIIENVQSGAKNAVSAMEKGSESTEACVAQASEAGSSLQSITGSVNEIHMMNTQIATAAEEQTTVSEDISKNINEISSSTNDIHSNVRQFNQLSANLAEMAEELSNITKRIKI